MLPSNVPDDAPAEVIPILQNRIPNYCPTCGEEVVLYGDPLDVSRDGFYSHIDTTARCMGASCDGMWRFGNALDQEDGHTHYTHPSGLISEEEGDEIFSDLVGWCNLHRQRMTKTKTHLVDGSPSRQWKCEECDLMATVIYDG